MHRRGRELHDLTFGLEGSLGHHAAFLGQLIPAAERVAAEMTSTPVVDEEVANVRRDPNRRGVALDELVTVSEPTSGAGVTIARGAGTEVVVSPAVAAAIWLALQ